MFMYNIYIIGWSKKLKITYLLPRKVVIHSLIKNNYFIFLQLNYFSVIQSNLSFILNLENQVAHPKVIYQ